MLKQLLFCLFASVVFATTTNAQSTVTISLSATELMDCDAISACDTVVTIFCSSSSSGETKCGETEEMSDDAFPIFPERFSFPVMGGAGEQWRFQLVDKDVNFDDPIGTVTISVDNFIQTTSAGQTMTVGINGRGFLNVKREA